MGKGKKSVNSVRAQPPERRFSICSVAELHSAARWPVRDAPEFPTRSELQIRKTAECNSALRAVRLADWWRCQDAPIVFARMFVLRIRSVCRQNVKALDDRLGAAGRAFDANHRTGINFSCNLIVGADAEKRPARHDRSVRRL